MFHFVYRLLITGYYSIYLMFGREKTISNLFEDLKYENIPYNI